MSRVCSFILIVCACAHPSAAQTSVAAAVDEGLQHNLTLLAARSNLTIAEAQMLSARLRPNPVFSFGADHQDWLGTGFDTANNGGPPEIAGRIDVPLERGGKRDARIALATAVRSAAEAQFVDAVRTLRQDVTLACVDLLAAQATRRLVGDTLRTYEDLARLNRARLTAGAIPPLEATRSDVAMLQFRASVVRADLEVAAAAARLRVLLGRDAGDSVEIDEPVADGVGPARFDAAALEELAVKSRPDLLSLQLSEARSIADLRLQEAIGRVDYVVGAEYRRQQGIAGRANTLGVFFSTPLPISNRNQGEIARATAEREQAERQIAARRAQVIADVRAAAHEYETTRDLLASIERDLMTPATHARDVSLYIYKAGGASLLEVLDAQRAFNDTMQSYVDAQAGVRRAAARLNAAVGSEVVK